MMIDILLIVAVLVIFYATEHVPYWLNVRERFILRLENDRLDVYIELQKSCLEAEFKNGTFEHDMLTFALEKYPTLSWKHIFRLFTDCKYRVNFGGLIQEFNNKINLMPPKARSIFQRMRSIDVKIVAVKCPLAFLCLFIFIAIKVVRSGAKTFADTESDMSALLNREQAPILNPA